MRKDLLPWYLRDVVIKGFEDDKSKKDDDKDDKSKSGDNDDDDDDADDDDKDDKGSKDTDTDGLKSALQKERRERKRLEKEARDLRKFKEEKENADKSEADKAKDDASKEKTKAERLAVKLRDTALDNAIIKLGGKLKFRDIDDALKLVDRSSIDIDQDEDDPSDIDIDESSVESALKTLAKTKPHLIVAEGQEDKSGSKFNGRRKSDKEIDEEALRDQYPSLRRSSHTS